MSWSYIQQTSAKATSAGVSKTTPAITITAGNLVVSGLVYYRGLSSTIPTTMSDSLGNTWTLAVTDKGLFPSNVTLTASIYSSVITNGGSATFTGGYTPDTFGDPFITVLIAEYNPGGGPTALDGTAGAHPSGSTSVSTGNITTTGTDLIVSVVNLDGYFSYAAGSGYAIRVDQGSASGQPGILEDQLNATAGTYAGTWTMGTTAGGVVVVAAFGGGPPYFYNPVGIGGGLVGKMGSLVG